MQKQRYFIGSFQLMVPRIDIPTGTCYKRGIRLNNTVEVLIKTLLFRTETGSRVAIALNCLLFALWSASCFSAFSAGYGRQGLVDKVVGGTGEASSEPGTRPRLIAAKLAQVIGVGKTRTPGLTSFSIVVTKSDARRTIRLLTPRNSILTDASSKYGFL